MDKHDTPNPLSGSAAMLAPARAGTVPAPRGWTARIPRPVKRWLRFAWEYPGYRRRLSRTLAYDRHRFATWSSANGRPRTRAQRASWITADYHKIEKALALRAPRPGFGAAVIHRLTENLRDYASLYGVDETWRIALNVLQGYIEFHAARNHSLPALDGEMAGLRRLAEASDSLTAFGGTLDVTRASIQERACLDLTEFFASRHSIRQFSPEPVSRDSIARAVGMAQKTPTVCNRQSPRVHVFLDEEDKRRVLACQQGNAGFGDQAAAVLAVTVDLRSFFAVAERNQGWIDGGLFAMSLVYALHSLGLGSCCLNWSVEREKDEALRRVAGLPQAESVIMLIAVGTLPESLQVAQSPRIPLENVLIWGRTRDPHSASNPSSPGHI